MKDAKITIEEIARRSNVSIATISRIINHKDNVKPETKQRVLSVMEEMQFKPKPDHKISDSSSKVILMLVPDFSNPFNSPVIDGVQKAAHGHGYDVLLLQSKDYYTNSSDYLNIIKNNSFAGILILSSAPNQQLLDELSFRCPVVMCSEYAEDYGVSYVSINDVEAAKKAVNYLISTGCKKIGLLNCNLKFKYARHREKGYLSALQEAGLETNPNWIEHISSINYNLAYSNAKHLLSLPDRLDAIFACSDVYAISAIRAAKELGLSVPQDISIVGFDNIELSIMSDPPITTIKQPCFDIGYQACELLVEKIQNPEAIDKQVILDTELIVRGSTKM
jgi:DNA-binding LacI/PurR family transcriptional regulator